MKYTNSSLISYTKISPNKSSPRNHVIDTITIHCYVGQVSVESAGTWFSKANAKCSCNYVIGVDGRIGLIVEEKDRSWCTSSSSNDHRAITIEVASDTTSPYAVNDKAYASLINLIEDICKRNNIKKLLWKGDKSLIGQVDKQNMTVHRWFANKSCPGDYLYGRHGSIASEVNKRLDAYNAPALKPVTGTPSTGSEADEKKIWDFLLNKIGNEYGVAGLMGNLYAESGLRSNNIADPHEKRLGYTDASYTLAVDTGTYDNFVRDSVGYGLAQWTYYSRKQKLLDFARSMDKSVGDLETQLEFLYKEIYESYKTVHNNLKMAASVAAASNSVLTGYECPANQSDAVKRERAAFGQKYYDKYSKNVKAPETPKVPSLKYVVGNVLNFRGGKQYSFSDATSGSSVNACKVKVTSVYAKGKHPYHCRSVNDAGSFVSGVYGWLDAADLSEIKVPVPSVSNLSIGDEVKLVLGAKYTSGRPIPSWLFDKVLYVRDIQKSSVVISTMKTGDITGVVYAKYLVKVGQDVETVHSYSVRVTADALNIRSGPGTGYAVSGTIRDKGIYTIVDESSGKGATVWGKLKSGAGWISLDHTEKI